MTESTSNAVADLIFAMEKDIRDAVSLMQALRRSSGPLEGERGEISRVGAVWHWSVAGVIRRAQISAPDDVAARN